MHENNNDALFRGQLIIGNLDCLVLFGCEPQGRLRELSKTLSDIALKDNGELDVLISELVVEINDFQKRNEKQSSIGLWRNAEKKRSLLIVQYNEILVYIDKMTVALQLQEAQLLKDNKLLQTMGTMILESSTDLQECIEEGKRVLDDLDYEGFVADGLDPTMAVTWKDRLVRKIEDLSVTHTVALQTIAQIKMMQDNNLMLIDKIVTAISVTIPVWRNQVSMLLGIEKLNQNLAVQKKVEEVTAKFVKHNSKKINKSAKKKELSTVDEEHLTTANLQLQKILTELSDVEKTDQNIRINLGNTLL
jgi:uncharacterized protein YaaN involved in tellurite resistance